MAFAPVFQRPFSATFDRRAAAAAVPWWTAGGAPAPVAVYQPKGAATLAASYVNLANPGTYDAAPGTAPTHAAATGWAFNGSSQHLLTGVVPAGNGTWSALVRFAGATAKDFAVPFGAQEGTGSKVFDVIPNSTSLGRAYENGGALVIAGGQTSGIMAVAGNAAYLNGAPETGSISNTPYATTHAIRIGCRNVAGSNALWWNGTIQAVAFWDTSTGHATWMPAVSAAVALI